MIFVTVGYQMAFDRLVSSVDDWAGKNPDADIFAQIGDSTLKPANLEFTRFIEPDEFKLRVKNCSVLVAHAGMGSIITALQYGKPILVMPRLAARKETRNDHQVATAKQFSSQKGIEVAVDEVELLGKLNRLACIDYPNRLRSSASPELIKRIRQFIASDK